MTRTDSRRLAVVECRTVNGDPDGVHLSVEEWSPRWEEWLTGMALCGRSAEQGALPDDTVVTCADCEGRRDEYERALAGRPTAGQEELDGLRARLAEAEALQQHWLRQTIEANVMVEAVREMHRPQMDGGGLPTGRCAGCGELHPCATRRLVPRKPEGEPCQCSSDCPKGVEL